MNKIWRVKKINYEVELDYDSDSSKRFIATLENNKDDEVKTTLIYIDSLEYLIESLALENIGCYNSDIKNHKRGEEKYEK